MSAASALLAVLTHARNRHARHTAGDWPRARISASDSVYTENRLCRNAHGRLAFGQTRAWRTSFQTRSSPKLVRPCTRSGAIRPPPLALISPSRPCRLLLPFAVRDAPTRKSSNNPQRDSGVCSTRGWRRVPAPAPWLSRDLADDRGDSIPPGSGLCPIDDASWVPEDVQGPRRARGRICRSGRVPSPVSLRLVALRRALICLLADDKRARIGLDSLLAPLVYMVVAWTRHRHRTSQTFELCPLLSLACTLAHLDSCRHGWSEISAWDGGQYLR